MNIDVLGTQYKIVYRSVALDCNLEDTDGYCDYTSKLIVIKSENNNKLGDFERHPEWFDRKSTSSGYATYCGLKLKEVL